MCSPVAFLDTSRTNETETADVQHLHSRSIAADSDEKGKKRFNSFQTEDTNNRFSSDLLNCSRPDFAVLQIQTLQQGSRINKKTAKCCKFNFQFAARVFSSKLLQNTIFHWKTLFNFAVSAKINASCDFTPGKHCFQMDSSI